MVALKTLLLAAVIVIAAGFAFIYSGLYNIAANDMHTAPVRWALETTRNQSIDRRDDSIRVPADLADMRRIENGARSYAAMCQICHLGPGVEPTPIHLGLNPQPPLFAKENSHQSDESLFWIIKNGIKMTGMPAWGATHSDKELWDIVAFLKKLPEYSIEQYEDLSGRAEHNSNPSSTHANGDSPAHSH